MKTQKFIKILEDLLKQDERFYFVKEKEFKKNKIAECGDKLDDKLISLLLSNKETEEKFFKTYKKNRKEITIFDKETFAFYINHHSFLPDSWTAFKNKIGLSNDKKNLLKKSKDISLVFPHKDCILQGGQTKEEDKRNEIFYNEILAPDEIDRLTEEKVLTNFKRFNSDNAYNLNNIDNVQTSDDDIRANNNNVRASDNGVRTSRDLSVHDSSVHDLSLKKDKHGNIKDNLIIKGNNFLALHSLKRQFAGKVKLIYIDPPYNTGNDGFKYNDNFNHSSWLVFMKNRLEVAKEFLREDGVIFVQADYNEVHYLKLLLDEIFGRDKFINEIIWKRKFGNANETRRLATAFDNILLYGKTENFEINLIKEKNSKHVQDYIKNRFVREDKEGRNKGRKWMPYPLANPGKIIKSLVYEYKGYQCPPKGWRMTIESLKKLDEEDRLYFPSDKQNRIQEKKFLDEYDGQPVDSLWQDIFVINSQSNEALNFDGQKPEDLLKRIMLIGTSKGDIVLDYHLGSGTTAAVAHKMERQYIGIEQMDYIETIAVERLKKVIGKKEQKDGELVERLQYDEGGISKAVNWQGGGEFVYCELAEYNQKFVNQIEQAKDSKELINLLEDIKKNGFLSYQFKEEEFRKNLEDFENLSLNQQKKILMELLDKNMLYLNYGDIGDERYGVGEDIVKLNEEFYGEAKK